MSMKTKQRFFDWSAPQFPMEVYKKRREALMALLPEDTAMLIPSRHGPDSGTFRQNDNFNYFTGLELPESVLCLDKNRGERLYLPHTDNRFCSDARPNDFPGRDLFDDPQVRERCGIAAVSPFEEFEPMLATLTGCVYVPLPRKGPCSQLKTNYIFHWDDEEGFAYHLMNTTALNLDNGLEFIARLRMVKGREEIEAIRTTVRITEKSIVNTLPIVEPGIDERLLIGRLEEEFRKQGAQRPAFDSIIKTGINAHCPWRILGSHYNRRNQSLVNGDVVIFDVGAEKDYYVADIGRTFPVGARFSVKQRDALNIVGDAVMAIQEAIRPGKTLFDLRDAAYGSIPAAHRRYMQVDSYFGHHIGLSAGDPSLLEQPLESGMVFTIEPWYYNHDEETSVFIEQNIAVTETGVDVLSSGLPIDPDSLEYLRRNA